MANDGNGTGSAVNGTDPIEQIMERAFQDLKPTIFTGSTNPLVAEAWVRDMEKIFSALPCTERQKVTFATFTLTDDAQEWWLLTLKKEHIVTLARFLEIFYEKYFLDSLREQKASKFIHLRKFEVGLDAEIKDRLEVLKLPTSALVVDRAYIAEKGIEALRSAEPSQRKRFWERDNRRPGVTPPKRDNAVETREHTLDVAKLATC
ncbi:uncharacterized protein LOC114303783 [Camellia sinensis]|uniref:uncharacterized protein LOC114303783 n=1 Tax=Camellia sinensis TaxID=4442 RepID=UPI001035AEA8|nr:uncharacterized protein LOC114303783 [Camellia sinensis]